MKFKNYINESSRMKNISIEEAIDHLLKYCSKNLKETLKGKVLYRGTKHSEKYFLGDSSKGKPRVSANTENYYTLMIDNSKYWKDYPKRSKSFICSTDQVPYGSDIYVVIPYDNTKMGVCPRQDMWIGFEDVLNGDTLEDFNDVLQNIFGRLPDGSWQLLKKELNNPQEINMEYNEYLFIDKWYEKYKKDNSVKFTNFWEKEFDPKDNWFKLINSIGKLPSDDREVWFSGKAVFILWRHFESNEFKENLKELI